MNTIYLLIVILIAFLYTNFHVLRKNKNIIAIILAILSILLYSHIELFYLLLAISIIIFFSKVKNEEFKNFNNTFNEYDFIDNIGEKFIKNKYDNRELYSKINIVKDKPILNNINLLDDQYIKKSKNIMDNRLSLIDNFKKQNHKYEYQNKLNDELYNSDYQIYNFENYPVDQINKPEWWTRYEELENNRQNIKNKVEKNNKFILDLQNNNQIINKNIHRNKKQLQNLREELDYNINVIDKNHKNTLEGMNKITNKYIHPKKQNKYYGEIMVNNPYDYLSEKKKYSKNQLINAYIRNPEIISKCLHEKKEETNYEN